MAAIPISDLSSLLDYSLSANARRLSKDADSRHPHPEASQGGVPEAAVPGSEMVDEEKAGTRVPALRLGSPRIRKSVESDYNIFFAIP
jgi:hypothetical protein